MQAKIHFICKTVRDYMYKKGFYSLKNKKNANFANKREFPQKWILVINNFLICENLCDLRNLRSKKTFGMASFDLAISILENDINIRKLLFCLFLPVGRPIQAL